MDTIQHQASIMHQAGHCIKPHIETVDFPGDTGDAMRWQDFHGLMDRP